MKSHYVVLTAFILLGSGCGSGQLRDDGGAGPVHERSSSAPAPAQSPTDRAPVSRTKMVESSESKALPKCKLTAPAADSTSTAESEKQMHQIYDALVAAIGDSSVQPKLAVKTMREPAVYSPKYETISVTSRLHDLCVAATGDSTGCLAFILGHELEHFRGQHERRFEITTDHVLPSDAAEGLSGTEKTARLVHTRTTLEAEADRAAGFYAYLAGYRALPAAADSLEQIYACFVGKEQIEGYLSLTERRRVLAEANKALDEYIMLFDAGNVLMAWRAHDVAAEILERVTKEFPAREIRNNAAVARLAEAAAIAPEEARYAYPLTLDLESSASRGAEGLLSRKFKDGFGFTGAREDREAAFRRLVETARDRLRQLVAQEENYLPAYINYATALVMLGDPDAADAISAATKRADRLLEADAITSAEAEIVRERTAILSALLKARTDESAAVAELERIGTPLAATNVSILKGEAPSTDEEAPTPDPKVAAAVNKAAAGVGAPDTSHEIHVDLGKKKMAIKLSQWTLADGGVLMEVRIENQHIWRFYGSGKLEWRGVSAGAPASALKAFGEPIQRFATPHGSLLAFSEGVIAHVGGDNVVSSVTFISSIEL